MRARALRPDDTSRSGGLASLAGGVAAHPNRGFDLVQLAAEDLDLVAELGCVLEAEVVRGGEHLLLELHDRARDLLRRHALLVLGAAAAAPGAALRHAAALLRQE